MWRWSVWMFGCNCRSLFMEVCGGLLFDSSTVNL